MRDVPPWRQRIQGTEGRPKLENIIPYTQQEHIHHKYQTDNSSRWTRPRYLGAIPIKGPDGVCLYLGNVRKGRTIDWCMEVFIFFTKFLGVIQAEVNRRGDGPFIHLMFATHQLAQQATHTINKNTRISLWEFGGNDKSLRATWARPPPAAAPEDLREQAWTLWQLHSFDDHKDHDPTIPPPTFPTTWSSWYRDMYRPESTVALNVESSACPDDIYRLYRSQLAGNAEEDLRS